VLIAGALDGMVPPDDALTVAKAVRHGEVVRLKGLGHLAHEEAPEQIADIIAQAAAGQTFAPSTSTRSPALMRAPPAALARAASPSKTQEKRT
jgi:hypothetical protein